MAIDLDDIDAAEAAWATVRRYCGWHVTPELSEEMVLDGPGGDLLIIPTLRLVTLDDLTEDGVAVDLADLSWSSRGLISKLDRCSWTHRYGGIVVNVNHGFANAPDFSNAVKSYMDRTASGVNGSERETVGPFTFGVTAAEEYCAFTTAEKAILDLYRLEP